MNKGRNWRERNNNAVLQQHQNFIEEEPYNDDLQSPFGVVPDLWNVYLPSVDGQVNHNRIVEERKETVPDNVMDILSGTSRYMTDTENMPVPMYDEAASQIYPPVINLLSPSMPLAPKHYSTIESVTTSSTDSLKNKKSNIHLVEGSPVNKLENVCKCNMWPFPSYALVPRRDNVPGFVAVCEFLDNIETGRGESEKEAREQAAIKMLKNLHINDSFTTADNDTSGHTFCCSYTKKEVKYLHDTKEKECTVSLTSDRDSEPCVQKNKREELQHKAGSGSHCQFPEFYLRPTGNKQYVWLLQSVASKMNFEVRYEIVPHLSSNSLAQCVVHLCKDPPIVCYGSAKSENKAKSSAARCAFEYLKAEHQEWKNLFEKKEDL